MIKKLLLKSSLLLCALVAGSGSVWADDVTLWSEDFSGYSKDDVPSGTISFPHTGTSLNASGTLSYSCTNGDGTKPGETKVYEENTATGTSPELLVGKYGTNGSTGGSFTAVIPLDNIEGTLTLTFYQNKQKLHVYSTTDGVSGGCDAKPSNAGQQTTTFTGITSSMTSITLVFQAYSSNVRLDNIVLKGTKKSGGSQSTTWSVTYNANGATSGDVPTDGTAYDADNNTVTVLGNTGSLAKTGYTFAGWNTEDDGTGTTYTAGNTFNISASTTLYAKWTANTHTVTLPATDTYGTYTMDATNPVAYGTEVTLTYTPATSYESYEATWSVNGTAISGNSFTMPDDAVTVTVSVEEVTEFTWDLTSTSYDADPSTETIQWSSNYATMKNERNGSNNTAVNNYIPTSNSSTRMYKNNELTITPASGYKITKVEFTATSENYATALKNSAWTNATASVVSNVVTVTPTNGVIAFSATIGGTCGFSSVTVRYEADTTPTITVSETTIDALCLETEGTIDVTYTNIADNSSAAIYFCDAQGTAASYDWVTAEINSNKDVDYLISANSGNERTAYMKVKVGDVYSDLITITQAKFVQATSYTLATEIVPGRHYIIVGYYNNTYKAMGKQNNNNRDAVEITVNNNKTSIESDAGIYEVLLGVDESGYFTLYDSENNGYLYAACGTGTGNYLRTETSLDNDGYGLWTITINESTSVANIAATNGSHNVMMYNSSNSIISCYASGQRDVYLYERDGDTGSQNFTVSINAACTDGKGKYYGTFSAPFAFTAPSDVTVSEIGVTSDELSVENYDAGAIIPANTGVMISSSTAGNKTFTSAKGGTSVKGNNNRLRASNYGITASEMTAADANSLFYRLTMHNGSAIGFWWGADEGASFAVAANKAYLAVPTNQSARQGFSLFGDDATGISDVNVNLDQNGVYDLQGRRVATPQKGLYIVNGKKQILK